jgi:hypothetical protein
MNRQQTMILTVVILGTLANIYGAVTRKPTKLKPNPDHSILTPVAGGLVVAIFLVAIATSESAATLAELFALAFFITSMADNGTDLINLITQVVRNPAQATSATDPRTPNPPTQGPITQAPGAASGGRGPA